MYLFYGRSEFIKYLNPDNMVLVNISAYDERNIYIDARELIPPNNLGAISSYDFDVRYMRYIMENDFIFMKFMNIVSALYYGNSVYIAINEEEWSINLIESLLKLVQQRYGIQSTFIRCPDDITYANEVDFNPEYGIRNFDEDKSRYAQLLALQTYYSSGGNINVHD